MVETGYPDLEIFDEVTEGIKLVGPAHESGAFPAGLTPAQQVECLSVFRLLPGSAPHRSPYSSLPKSVSSMMGWSRVLTQRSPATTN